MTLIVLDSINTGVAYFLLALLPALMVYIVDSGKMTEYLCVFFLAFVALLAAAYHTAFAGVYIGVLLFQTVRVVVTTVPVFISMFKGTRD